MNIIITQCSVVQPKISRWLEHGPVTVGGTAKPVRPAEAGAFAANEPGHLSEGDDTASSLPYLMQWDE